MQSIFDHIFNTLIKNNINLILIGGFSLSFYKVTRRTTDIDFLINKDDINKAKNLLAKNDFELIYENNLALQFRNNKITFLNIDFIIVDNKTFESMFSEGKKVTIKNYEFTIPNLNHLIALKLHAIKSDSKRKYKDLTDIFDLIQHNSKDLINTDIISLCETYADSDTKSTIFNELKL